ncbi:MAG: hypothetical protein LW817_06990 [Candidatus Caenarcaniphilales bacterium]|jgi:hypothetical protein|nr:hypothetical protein [Candidatus Caenarcaniphilales bacterium]
MKLKNIFLLFSILIVFAPKAFASKLLMIIEKRDIAKDKIIEYRVFDDGIINSTIMNSSASASELFQSSFKTTTNAKRFIELLEKVKDLDHLNDFPWQENYYKRGDVIKLSFVNDIKLNHLEPSSKNNKSIKTPVVYFFYTGHENNPAILKELMTLVE